jgi:hypothetical protein
MTIVPQALSLVETAELVQVGFTLCLRDQWSMWMQDGCRVYMDSYMALNGSCFMVTRIIFNNHLQVGLTQNWETLALQILTIIDVFYFILCKDLHENYWMRDWSHMTGHATIEDPWPHYMILKVSWDGLWTLSFGLTISWLRLLACVWSGPKFTHNDRWNSNWMRFVWGLGSQIWEHPP